MKNDGPIARHKSPQEVDDLHFLDRREIRRFATRLAQFTADVASALSRGYRKSGMYPMTHGERGPL